MALQARMLKFHDKIKLTLSERENLQEKSDILIDELRDCDDLPSFDPYDQGSYAIHLGVRPPDDSSEKSHREYDVDVALRLKVNKDDEDPFTCKNTIKQALNGHTKYGTQIKKPCVTVTYSHDGEPAYHVDLVAYAYENKDDDASQMYIAKGKTQEDAQWERADPIGLVDYISDAIRQFDDPDQFRRVVRYIKRWKSLKFSPDGHNEPPSIGLTLIALETFKVFQSDDLSALLHVAREIDSRFVPTEVDAGEQQYMIECRIPAHLKFEPGTNVFEKMSVKQMTTFKKKLERLIERLEAAQDEDDEIEQCRILQNVFGEDFEVPQDAGAARKQRTFIPRTSHSG